MELIKRKEPLKFVYEDVTFLIKPQASAADKMEVMMSGRVEATGVRLSMADFNKALVRSFVVGWKGVTLDGREVPYSYETLADAFPVGSAGDVFTLLGNFILEKTDVFKKDELLKKGSREQLHGASR